MVHARTAAAFSAVVAAAVLTIVAGGAFAGDSNEATPNVFAQAAAAGHTAK